MPDPRRRPSLLRRLAGSIAMASVVAAAVAAGAPAGVSAADPITEGIDISHWQGEIDWTQVAASGKRFAYMKASDDIDFVDPTYGLNRARAKAAGLVVGAYHFARPDATPGDAVAEADHFLAAAEIAEGDLPPVLDLEKSGGLTDAKLRAWVRAYVERIRAQTGVHPAIYASPNFWKNYLDDTDEFAMSGYRTLWIAHWTTASQPTVPAANWAGYGWTFWQYTSDGSVPGIAGRVDLDRYDGADLAMVVVDPTDTGVASVSDTPFRDIASSKFAKDIAWLYVEGLTGGCSATKFCPDGKVTRGQMAAFLARALDLPKSTKDYFKDDESSSHEADINRLARAGLTSGCGAGKYCPNDLVTRGQLASFLARVLDLSATGKDHFRDDEGSTHESNINRIARAGLTSGCATRKYCPTGVVTRGQMAAFLHRTFDD